MSFFSIKPIIWSCLVSLMVCRFCTADASTTFDAVPLIQQHVQQLSSSDLAESITLFTDILSKHNIRKESPILQRYIELLQAVLQPDCCDYFTALPTVKGLTSALASVLQLNLPASLRPVVRRSYVGAIWLLQRSRLFKWDTRALHSAAMSGLHKLYDAHVTAAAGRSISFHHISKTGGTSLCSVAWDNGCRGPGMSKKDNCLLDIGTDGPAWVLRHNATAVHKLSALPPPPPTPPVMADPAAEEERLKLAAVVALKLKQRSYDWFMYDCPAEKLVGRLGRGCRELQEGAISKSATFFANENTLPMEHGAPQVCDAFINVVILRDSLSEVMSLMSEVSLVYTRLVKQGRVLGWTPPKWDLEWWNTWAPVVVNSYATRTLLGAPAYCPPLGLHGAESSPTAAAVQSSATSTSASSSGLTPSSSSSSTAAGRQQWLLSEFGIQRALHVLASFDIVLDLNSIELMDASLKQLLGWSTHTYSQGRHQRPSRGAAVPSWEQLELLARQLPPLLNASLLPGLAGSAGSTAGAPGSGPSSSSSSSDGSSSSSSKDATALDGSLTKQPLSTPSQGTVLQGAVQGGTAAAAAADSAGVATASANVPQSELDGMRRLVGEMRVRQVFKAHGMAHALLPLSPEVPLLQPPAAVVGAAMAAVAAVQQATVAVETVTDGLGDSHTVLHFRWKPQARTAASNLTQAAPPSNNFNQAAVAAAAVAAAAAGDVASGSSSSSVYHVWLKHGVVLDEHQYQQLLASTAADARLYKAGRVMQALDAAWVSVLGQQRSVRKMLVRLQEESQAACGFAGLNHLQQR